MLSIHQHVILVDEKDRPIGTEEKLQAHIDGKRHRAFSVCIFKKKNNKLYLLLQQRARTKYHSKGLWSNTCCSHPTVNGCMDTIVARRLKEEMGMEGVPLTHVGSFEYKANVDNQLIEHEIDHIFIGLDHGVKIQANPEEVMNYHWVELTTLIKDIDHQPEQYTKWFKGVLNIAIPAIKKVAT